MKTNLFFCLFLFLGIAVQAQQSEGFLMKANVHEGDTLLIQDLDELVVFPKFKNRYQARRYDRLVSYVKKVYPYAQIASVKIKEYEQIIAQTPDPAQQRKIMKRIEGEIYDEWGEDLKELTYTQGSILLKLIDRESGESSYDLVKEFRGSFRAFFYQSFARVFGFNLKDRYDPKGKDKQIEYIVRLIETNRL